MTTDLKPFVTGSRVYGIPRLDSDIDLVMFYDLDVINWLISEAQDVVEMSHNSDPDEESEEYHGTGLAMRFGKLNIIVPRDEEEFKKWKQCTEYLEAKMYSCGKRFSKEESAKIFRQVIDNGVSLEYIEKMYFPTPLLSYESAK